MQTADRPQHLNRGSLAVRHHLRESSDHKKLEYHMLLLFPTYEGTAMLPSDHVLLHCGSHTKTPQISL